MVKKKKADVVVKRIATLMMASTLKNKRVATVEEIAKATNR